MDCLFRSDVAPAGESSPDVLSAAPCENTEFLPGSAAHIAIVALI